MEDQGNIFKKKITKVIKEIFFKGVLLDSGALYGEKKFYTFDFC
jgi:hypothetical protein